MASDDFNPYQSPLSTHAPPMQVDDTPVGAPANRSARFVASTIDVFLLLSISFPVLYLSGYFQRFFTDAGTWFDELVAAVVSIFVHYLIQGYWLATRGQTVGKRVMGIRIEDRNTGALIPFSRMIFLRDFPLMLPAYLLPVIAFRTMFETWGA